MIAAYSQADLDAEDALPKSHISDGEWNCKDLLDWKVADPVCTDNTEELYKWARNCPVNCFVRHGGILEGNICYSSYMLYAILTVLDGTVEYLKVMEMFCM